MGGLGNCEHGRQNGGFAPLRRRNELARRLALRRAAVKIGIVQLKGILMKKSASTPFMAPYLIAGTVFVSAVVLSYSDAAHAKISGRALMEQCASSLTVAQTVCNTYIEGLIEGHTLSTGGTMGKTKFFCMPLNASTSKAKKIIVKYLRKNAAELERNAGELVYQALADAWPCN